MNNQSCFTTTSKQTGSWVESDIKSSGVSSTTNVSEPSCVVMFQVKNVMGARGQNELLVSIDSASLERKLAVKKMAAQLNGQAVTSTTASL